MSDGIRLKSSIESLRGLIEEVQEGRIRLPAFQRAFTWNNKKVADLFDSVAKSYPIGSLFFWNTLGEHRTSDLIGSYVQPKRRAGAPVSLVVDGHHRVATLAGVLLARDDAEDLWRLFYDPVNEMFTHARPGKPPEPSWVRVASMVDMLGLLSESRRLVALDEAEAKGWVKRVERVARAITEYQIPVIGYSGDLGSAMEVFARLNQKGKAMGADELMSALTYREADAEGDEFRLADQIDALVEEVEATGFGTVDRTFVLRAIFAAADLDIYAKDWGFLTKERDKTTDVLKEAIESAAQGLLAAVLFLRQEGILSVRQLSYGMQLVALSAYLSIEPHPDAVTRRTLARMLWVSSFSAWFGPPAQERALVRELRAVAKAGLSVDRLSSFDLEAAALPMPSRVDQKSARVRALVNVLVAARPRRVDGSHLGDDIGTLFLTREANALSRIFVRGPKELLASPANRVVAVANDARSARVWLREIAPEKRDEVLLSLAVPPGSFELLEEGDATPFLEARLRYLDDLERKFMKEKGVTPPKPGAKPAPSPIDTDD